MQPVSMPSQIVLASGNAGKIREIVKILAMLPFAIIPQGEFDIESPQETGITFMENALLKARFAAAKSGLPSIGDDSGISVDALRGRPGVRSARYAGEDANDAQNLDKLLLEMAEVPDGDRGGEFHCAAALVFPDPNIEPIVAEATWRGEILRRRSGTGGFGYDPIFFDTNRNKSAAQMNRDEKDRLSHRGQAFLALRRQIQAITR